MQPSAHPCFCVTYATVLRRTDLRGRARPDTCGSNSSTLCMTPPPHLGPGEETQSWLRSLPISRAMMTAMTMKVESQPLQAWTTVVFLRWVCGF